MRRRAYEYLLEQGRRVGCIFFFSSGKVRLVARRAMELARADGRKQKESIGRRGREGQKAREGSKGKTNKS